MGHATRWIVGIALVGCDGCWVPVDPSDIDTSTDSMTQETSQPEPTSTGATGRIPTGATGTVDTSPTDTGPVMVDLFFDDPAGWEAVLGGSGEVIDFDDQPSSGSAPFDGTAYEGLPGAPTFTLIDGPGMHTQSSGQIPNPPSPPNMLAPTCNPSCEGIIRVTFGQPISGVGAIFVDVEADWASTGLSRTLDASVPDFPFPSDQTGQSTQVFLGITSSQPFSEVDIHFATGPNIDGVLIDDLRYVVAP